MDIEDLVCINGKTKFEDMNTIDCLNGMKSHLLHNGVILDGLRRLSNLCGKNNQSELLILSNTWIISLFIPIMNRYQEDNRVQAFIFCILGTCIRKIDWNNENNNLDIYNKWEIISTGILTILKSMKTILSVNSYGIYYLCGITLIPNNINIFNILLENDLIVIIEECISIHWNNDNWLSLNLLLLLKYLNNNVINKQFQLLDKSKNIISSKINKDFSWDNIDELMIEYNK